MRRADYWKRKENPLRPMQGVGRISAGVEELVSEVCKNRRCRYKTKVGTMIICDYIGSTNTPRGCVPSKCEKWKESDLTSRTMDPEEICGVTNNTCTKCSPGPCQSRRKTGGTERGDVNEMQ